MLFLGQLYSFNAWTDYFVFVVRFDTWSKEYVGYYPRTSWFTEWKRENAGMLGEKEVIEAGSLNWIFFLWKENQMALYEKVMRDEEAWSSFYLPSPPHPRCSDQSKGFRATFSWQLSKILILLKDMSYEKEELAPPLPFDQIRRIVLVWRCMPLMGYSYREKQKSSNVCRTERMNVFAWMWDWEHISEISGWENTPVILW